MDIKYNITYHAIERLQERFGQFCSQIPVLKNWKREQGLSKIKLLFNDLLNLTAENKSYINNSSYMIGLYEKYGYDTEYCFLEFKEQNILFLLTKNRSAKDYLLVTLMPMEYRPGVKNIKYGGKEEKEMAFNNFLNKWSKSEVQLSNKAQLSEFKSLITKKLPQLYTMPIKAQENEPIKVKTIETTKVIPILDPETKLLHQQLIASIAKNNAIQIERLSNSKCMYMMTIDNKEYEFTYAKTNSGVKTVTINNVIELNEQQKANFANGFRELYPKTNLYKTLLNAIDSNEAELVSNNNEQQIYKVTLDTNLYNVTVVRKNNEDPQLIIRQKNNTTLNVSLDYEQLEKTGQKLSKDDPLYIKLLESLNNQDFKMIEKYSLTVSLRVSTIDNIDYQYIYIKRNNKEKDREIILHNPEKVNNHTLYESQELIQEPKKMKMK